MTFKQIIAPMFALALLGACGGASTGLQYVPAPASGINQIAELSDAFDDAFPRGSDTLIVTEASALQTEGTASFTGYLTIAQSRLSPFLLGDYRVTARTSLDVDFDSGEITSETGQFYEATDVLTPEYGARRDGSVDYTLSAITEGSNFYSGTITGTVETTAGQMTSVNETIVGSVMGQDGEGFRAASVSDIGLDVQVYALED